MKIKIILLISFPIFFSSCISWFEDGEIIDRTLTSEEKALIPFQGDEQLLFVSNHGDSIVFQGQGYQNYFPIQYLSINSDDKYKNEYLELKFQSKDNMQDEIIYSLDKKSDVYFSIMSKVKNHSYFLRFLIEQTFFRKNNDSLEVRGVIYHDVYEGKYIKDSLQKSYYSKEIGLIRLVNLQDSLVWDFAGRL